MAMPTPAGIHPTRSAARSSRSMAPASRWMIWVRDPNESSGVRANDPRPTRPDGLTSADFTDDPPTSRAASGSAGLRSSHDPAPHETAQRAVPNPKRPHHAPAVQPQRQSPRAGPEQQPGVPTEHERPEPQAPDPHHRHPQRYFPWKISPVLRQENPRVRAK